MTELSNSGCVPAVFKKRRRGSIATAALKLPVWRTEKLTDGKRLSFQAKPTQEGEQRRLKAAAGCTLGFRNGLVGQAALVIILSLKPA